MRRRIVELSLLAAAFSANATAQTTDTPEFRCPPVESAITVDGQLDEWSRSPPLRIDEENLVLRDPQYLGPSDLSGQIYVARDANTLYVAGRINDDTLFWNPRIPWKGDGVELFLDFLPDPTARAADSPYDSYTSQLILHPLAQEVRWSFARYQGREGQMDDPVDGIRLAGLPLRDARGGTVGYTFELALPLCNFRTERLVEGRLVGFDVALSDSDGLPEQKNYATWSRHQQLAQYPARFGRMVLGAAPPEVEEPDRRALSPSGPLAVLCAVLGALLFVWLSRLPGPGGRRLASWLERIRQIPTRPKLIAALVLFAALAVTRLAADRAASVLAERDVAAHRQVAATIRDAAAEARRLGLLDASGGPEPSPLVALLAGRAVAPPVRYDYALVAPVAEVPHRTEGGTPFLRRDLPTPVARAARYVVQPPSPARRVHVVHSWHLAPGRDAPPDAGTPVAEVRCVREDGRVAPAIPIVLGRDVVPFGAEGATPTGAQAAFTGTVPGQNGKGRAWEVTVDVPPDADAAPVVRVEVEAKDAGGTYVLHGVTLEPTPGGEPRRLPLGRATEGGVPTGASPYPRPEAVAELSRASELVVLRDLDVRADRLWVVAGLARPHAPERYRAAVVLIDAVFQDGSVDQSFQLENGVNIEALAAPARQHAPTYTAEPAFEWGTAPDGRRHYDVVSIPLERAGRRLAELQFQFVGTDEVVEIAGVTAGAEQPLPASAATERLDAVDDGYALAAPDLEALAGMEFTLFRDGAAVATTLPGEPRQRTLARTLAPARLDALAEQPDGMHETRVVDGERLDALLVPLSGGAHGDVLEMVWRSEAHAATASTVALVRGILAALLVPLLVLLVADLILRVRSLHARLVATIAAAAAVPIVMATFAVPQLVGSKIEGTEQAAVLEKSSAVLRRLAALRSLARQRAESALADEALREALRRRDSPDMGAAIAAALRDIERSVAASAGGEARVALEVTPPPGSGAEPLVFPEQARWTVFKSPLVGASGEAFAKRWSRLYASGVARAVDPSEWSATMVVELPLERSVLDDAARAAGGGVQVLLYSPSGYPLAATLDTHGEEIDSERARKRTLLRRLLQDPQPVVEPQMLKRSLHTVAYDVLREGADAVCLVATAAPRAGTEALVRRVENVSLLIFGAGVVMQFLLAGVVVGGATRRFQRALGRARLAVPVRAERGDDDEIGSLDTALRELRRERETYRTELSVLHDAVERLGLARTPDEVVSTALTLLRESTGAVGALFVGEDDAGRLAVLGGFRGDERVEPCPLRLADDAPLAVAIAQRREWHGDAAALAAPDGDRALAGAALRLESYPCGGEGGARGAVLLLRGAADTENAVCHAEFAAVLARHAGQALASARLVRMAVHDADTGAYVAAYFMQRLGEEVDRGVAARRPVALLLLRSDGPAAGAAAREERARLATAVRERAPARAFLGALEQGVLALAVPESDREGAEALARDLQRHVAERGPAAPRVTIGVAACPEDAGSLEFLIAEARRALAGAGTPRSADAPRLEERQQRLVTDARALGAVFVSPKSVQLLETIERIAASDLTILVEGETGVGKEIVADLIHRKSARGARALVKVNCAALPDALLESELFGYEPGAFTGADRRKPGRFELADGGTIFLDEIGDMPAATQVKLLRVLEAHAVEHLGGTQPIAVDVRVVAATNRDLRRDVATGRFREDLFYRLNAVSIAVPPLRARKEDIPALAQDFVRRAAEAAGRRPPEIAPDAMDLLYRHPWPGNVRELRNVLDQAVVLSGGDVLRAGDVRPALASATALRAGVGRSQEVATSASSGSPDELSDRQRRVLALLAEQEWITNTDYCEVVGVSTRTGLRDLHDLMQRGLLHMEGKRRGARYRLAR